MTKKLLLCAAVLASSICAAPIATIDFHGNEKISSKTLQKITRHHLGQPLEPERIHLIEEEVEHYYRKHNFALAFVHSESIDEGKGKISFRVGKYADFNERSLKEMERRTLEKGKVNRIFFVGNEKISTNRLMNLIEPFLGKENNEAITQEIVKTVQEHYRKQNFPLAYATLKSVDEQGIVTVQIQKYPDFKTLYAREGK